MNFGRCHEAIAAHVETPIFRASNHSNKNESPSCISAFPGFGPQFFAYPCDWPRAENIRFSGPYGESEIDEEAYANAILARALVAQRKYAQAQEAMRLATEQSSKSEDRAVRLATAIAVYRVRAASGQTAEAMKDLQPTLAEAARYGYEGYQLEGRLALGEIEMNSGKPGARAHLEALEQEARSKGFGLIAKRAASVRTPRTLTIKNH